MGRTANYWANCTNYTLNNEKINMENSLKLYSPKKEVMGGGLVVLAIAFLGLTLPLIVEGSPVPLGKLLGLSGFWLLGTVLTLIPFTFKLEIGPDFIKSYFFGFCIRELHAANIIALEYGNIVRFGAVNYGKGLKGLEIAKDGGRKYFSMGENFYGKEAIGEARRALSNSKKIIS